MDIPNVGKINLIVGKNATDNRELLGAMRRTCDIIAIDGIGDGMHYTTQDAMWSELFSAMRNHSIQMLATTNSRDTVESFSKVASTNKDTTGVIIRLGRSAKTSNKGDIIATVMDADMLADAIAAGIEVR